MSTETGAMDSDQVLVDPSILLSDKADKLPPEGPYEEFDFVISESFANVVNSNSEYVGDAVFGFFSSYLDFHEMTPYGELASTVEKYDTFSYSDVEMQYTEQIDYEAVQQYFQRSYSPNTEGEIANVLYDQFVFLFEQSWIASRVRMPQDEVTDVPGLRKFIFERDELDAIANQLPDEYRRKIQTLKGGRRWNWIGLGIHLGSAAFAGPIGEAIFHTGLVQNCLGLLFDP